MESIKQHHFLSFISLLLVFVIILSILLLIPVSALATETVILGGTLIAFLSAVGIKFLSNNAAPDNIASNIVNWFGRYMTSIGQTLDIATILAGASVKSGYLKLSNTVGNLFSGFADYVSSLVNPVTGDGTIYNYDSMRFNVDGQSYTYSTFYHYDWATSYFTLDLSFDTVVVDNLSEYGSQYSNELEASLYETIDTYGYHTIYRDGEPYVDYAVGICTDHSGDGPGTSSSQFGQFAFIGYRLHGEENWKISNQLAQYLTGYYDWSNTGYYQGDITGYVNGSLGFCMYYDPLMDIGFYSDSSGHLIYHNTSFSYRVYYNNQVYTFPYGDYSFGLLDSYDLRPGTTLGPADEFYKLLYDSIFTSADSFGYNSSEVLVPPVEDEDFYISIPGADVGTVGTVEDFASTSLDLAAEGELSVDLDLSNDPDFPSLSPDPVIQPEFPFLSLDGVWKYVVHLFSKASSLIDFLGQTLNAIPQDVRWCIYGVIVLGTFTGVIVKILI